MNNEWCTPKNVIEIARDVFGGTIDLDPASNDLAQQYIQAKQYYTIDTDGLTKEWAGNVWLNPPYCGGSSKYFVDKLINSPKITQSILLVNYYTDTSWFHDLLNTQRAMFIVKGS